MRNIESYTLAFLEASRLPDSEEQCMANACLDCEKTFGKHLHFNQILKELEY